MSRRRAMSALSRHDRRRLAAMAAVRLALPETTKLIGTGASGAFLCLIAGLNLVILIGLLRVFREMRRGRYNESELEQRLNSRGLMNRFYGRFARSVKEPWQMYLVGLLFGLGFDTATEVALLFLRSEEHTSELQSRLH